MFGDVLPPDADQQRFAYPAYTAVLLAPFALFPPDVATALWMSLQIVALTCALSLWFDILGWYVQRWMLISVLLVAFRYPFTLYLIAQFTGVIILFLTLGIYFLMKKHDIAAGTAFAVATLQPTISAPLAAVILLLYALRGRQQGLAAFSVTLGVLIAVTVARIGWWIPDFLDNLGDYAGYATYYLWTPELFESPPVQVVFVASVLVAAGWVMWRFIAARHQENLEAAFSPTHTLTISLIFSVISACLLLLPQTGSYYLMLLLPLLLASLRNAAQTQGAAKKLALLACGSGFLIPWFYLMLPEETRRIESLLLPLHVSGVWVGTTWLARRSLEGVSRVGATRASPLQQDSHA
jgi:hypothetical protein